LELRGQNKRKTLKDVKMNRNPILMSHESKNDAEKVDRLMKVLHLS
jgi:hypothetical protein